MIFHPLQRPAPRPALHDLALAVCLACFSVATTGVWAQAATPPSAAISQAALDGPARPLAIAAGSLGGALSQAAVRLGLALSFDPALTEGRNSLALSGNFTPRQAFGQLLSGSGLEVVVKTDGSLGLQRAKTALAPAPESDRSLAAVTVRESADVLGEQLAKPLPGGELARGAGIGVLGQRDLFELPVSVKSFTEQAIRDRIAFTSNDVVSRDASFTGTGDASLNGSTAGRLRGFRVEPFESTYDGFSSVASRRYSVEFLERVDILKGPTTLFTGAIGGVGGTLNYVSKKPLEQPLSRVTLGFFEQGQYGVHADISRRFGVDDALGLRLNLAQRDGETAIDGVDEKSRVAHLAFNWRNEVANLDVQYGHLQERVRGASGGYFFGSGQAITPPPRGSQVSGPDWDTRATRDEFLRAALDVKLSDGWSAFAVLGTGKNRERFFGLGSPSVINAAGDADSGPFVQNGDARTRSADLGLRGRFRTGPVNHALTLSYAHYRNASAFQDLGTDPGYVQPRFNIYNPASYEGPAPALVGSGQFFPFTENTVRGLVLVDELSLLDDRLKVTAGLRHTRIGVDTFRFGAATPDGRPSGIYNATDTSPSFGVLYKFTPQISVYGNLLKAVEAASTAPVDAVNAGAIIPPGVATQREVGAKFDFGSLGLTTALFEIERPSTYTDPASRVFGQFGRNRHRGLEVDLFGEPTKGLRTQFSYTYLDAKVLRNQNPALEGNRPVSVPRNVLVFSADADVPGFPGLAVLAGVRHVGRQFYYLINQRSIASFTVFDAGARYSFKSGSVPMVLRLGVNNLFDKDHYQFADFTVQSGAPRTVRAILQADF